MKTPAEWKTLFESSAFARQTNYSGPLGPEYNPSGTRLRLWAPTAQKVSVNLYRRGDGGACMGTLPLERHGQGVWSVYLPGDQHGHYYTFTVEVDGTAYETGDPYARTAGVNGLRSMILDAPRIDPPDWNHDHRVIVPASRRTVWEVSVRDFSQDPACGVRNAWRGKFMAFTQKGTTLSSAGTFPTCLDYLKRLGVGYVQLMPIFDFGSVDESRPLTRQYNWGYDPTNYNVPEGSYSTDPTKGEVRVRECKEMIAALHAAGIGVIMDVVYNHMYRNENPLNSTVPYYFFRQNPDGSFSNGSGCGNEFASERPMARKYLIDSVLYWAQEYHIDGFRFDLMGLYDVDTMNELRAALDALPGGRSILMYGEPWQGSGSQLHRYEANKANLAMLSERIGVFCDNTRDVIKGGCFDAREPGYVEGKPGSFWDIGGAVAAEDLLNGYDAVVLCCGAGRPRPLGLEGGDMPGVCYGTAFLKAAVERQVFGQEPALPTAEGRHVVVIGTGDTASDCVATALRQGCAMVLQKNTLFSGTILDNLRWGNPEATDAECVEACQAACADEFIDRLPDGYHTVIQRGGSNVSGGQKQRLCIARALLKKPKILILDDSTSAVDTATDAKIRAAFSSELKDTTKLIIAQRVASVCEADLILVMDGGHIVAQGTHAELMKNSEIYREVYESQQEGVSIDG